MTTPTMLPKGDEAAARSTPSVSSRTPVGERPGRVLDVGLDVAPDLLAQLGLVQADADRRPRNDAVQPDHGLHADTEAWLHVVHLGLGVGRSVCL